MPFAPLLRFTPRVRWALAGMVVGILGVIIGFGPFVRSRVASEAARRGLEVTVDDVHAGWFEVRLVGVRVRPIGVALLHADFTEAKVELGATLSAHEVVVAGGRVDVEGTPDEVARAVEAWRSQRPPQVAVAGRKLAITVTGLSVTWKARDEEGLAFEANGVALHRDDGGLHAQVDSARASWGRLGCQVNGAQAELDGVSALKSAKVTTADIWWEASESAAAIAPSPPGTGDPAPPPLLVAVPVKTKGGSRAATAPASSEVTPPLIALPRLHELRAAASSIAGLIAAHLPEASAVRVDGLTLRLQKKGERISLGPGPLEVAHRGETIELSFSTGPAASGTPLSIHARLPSDSSDADVSLAGGPVSLSLLGVKEGAAGLTEVDRATVTGKGRVVLDGRGEALTFDGALSVRGLAVNDPRLALDLVRGLDFAVSARGVLDDKGELRLDDADFSMGAIHVTARGALEQTADHAAGALRFDLPVATCNALLTSIPTALLPTVGTAKMSGTLGGQGRIAFDTRKLDDLVLDYDIVDRCRMTEVPEDLEKERFTKSFEHRVYGKEGEVSMEVTGPETPNWSAIDRISPYVQVAVLTTEDGAFFHHHGFNHAAIRNALIADLKARRFVRGASTITMQLAKNLFLSREKTLSRKLEELILVDYLEQVFSKDETMELYLNIIEFGPDIYGITAAADHYFGRKPEELNLAEALFLSSILPQPVYYHRIYEKGEVSDGWMRGIRQRMELAQKNGRITPQELAEGLTEAIVFHRPDQPRPPPRPPMPGVRREGQAGEWQELN